MPTYPETSSHLNSFTRPGVVSPLDSSPVTVMHDRDHGNIADVWENVVHYGAAGDGVQDDAPAIQAAIDTNAACVYIPPARWVYQIGTPLVPQNGQLIIGGTGEIGSGTASGTYLTGRGANTHIFDLSGGGDSARFENLSFWDRSLLTTPLGQDIAFYMGTGTRSQMTFSNLRFFNLDYAFRITGTAGLLSCRWEHCRSRHAGAYDFSGSGYFNNNGFFDSFWQNLTLKSVPAVYVGPLASEVKGLWFNQCYWESVQRQAVKWNDATATSVRDSYVEDYNRDVVTYTTKDGITSMPLPAFDYVHETGATHITAGNTIDNVVLSQFNTFPFVGSSDFSGAGTSSAGDITLSNMAQWNGAGVQRYDFSNFSHLAWNGKQNPVGGTAAQSTITFGALPWNGGAINLDASWSDYFQITPNASGAAITINAPTRATTGRRMTIEFYQDATHTAIASVTWNAIFKKTGTFPTLPITSTKRTAISFYYDGTSWIETGRTGEF